MAGNDKPQPRHATGSVPARDPQARPIRLKELARHLGLNPSTVSVVLNETPGRSIPEETRRRIKEAAKRLNYQPNLVARSIRNRRTMTVGILVPELNDGYHTEVMSGVGDCLVGAGYFYLTAHHRHHPRLTEEYARMLVGRGAEGILCIDTALDNPLPVPAVAVAGHRAIAGVTNIVLDQRRAAELIIEHLAGLGHRDIAFMRGPSVSCDADERWSALERACEAARILLRPELVVRLRPDISSPELGYPVVQPLLRSERRFTALVCFNDVSAIGAIRAIRDAGLRVPEDISVVGFDDIRAAAYASPNLTTIRQPLGEMGTRAAQCLLERMAAKREYPAEILFAPQLMVRESTGPAPAHTKKKAAP